jgi:hypothetical protein
MRGDCVGGSSSSIEAVERGEADEADEASTGTFFTRIVFIILYL